jgi:Zn-dependent protease
LKVVFRKSVRGEQMRFVVIGLVLFLLGWFLLDVSWVSALIVAGVTAGGYVLGRLAYQAWRSSILVDDAGIESRRGLSSVRMAWDEIVKLELATARLRTGRGEGEARCGVILDARGRRVAFSDLSLVRGRSMVVVDEDVVVHDLAEPEILLALVARRIGDERFLPAEVAEDVEAVPEKPERRVDVAGLGAVVVKLGGKIGKAVAGVFKVVKPGFAVVSGTVYALIFDWKFALGLMGMLLFHEYGHVHAVRRSGLPVRGIYFIPLLGAAAVTDSTWKTRAQQAYIALNGPLWGLYLTLPLFAAGLAFGEAHPIIPAMASWWALINLFNLLPINPLDGGRLLNAVSHSLHSGLGIAVSGAAIVAGVTLALVTGIHLFVVVGLFGLLEFVGEIQTSRAMARLRMAGIGEGVPAESLVRLRAMVRPSFRAEDELRIERMDLARTGRLLSMARIRPMAWWKTLLWGLLYLGLVAAFMSIILLTAGNPAADMALDILR